MLINNFKLEYLQNINTWTNTKTTDTSPELRKARCDITRAKLMNLMTLKDHIMMTVKRSTIGVLSAYESKLLELLHTCRKCYSQITERKEIIRGSTQIRFEMIV